MKHIVHISGHKGGRGRFLSAHTTEEDSDQIKSRVVSSWGYALDRYDYLFVVIVPTELEQSIYPTTWSHTLTWVNAPKYVWADAL